ADEADLLFGQPFRGVETDAGLAVEVLLVVLHPPETVAGVDEHDVAGVNLGLGEVERLLQIGGRDDGAGGEAALAADGGAVEYQAAGKEHASVLDAELLQAVGAAELGELVAVVEDVVVADVHADVAEAVELRADLADLAADQLIIVDEAILAH